MKYEKQIIEKPMHAFIINCERVDIGYIQYYNKHDFPAEQGYDTSELPGWIMWAKALVHRL